MAISAAGRAGEAGGDKAVPLILYDPLPRNA